MKKLLLGLFLVLSSLCFGAWQLVDIKDDFGDEVIATSTIYSFGGPTPVSFSPAMISINENSNKSKFIIIAPKKFIGFIMGNQTTVKFKIDDNEPIEFTGILSKDAEMVVILETQYKDKFNKLMTEMCNGKEFKVVIKDYADNTILEKGDLKKFKEFYSKIKSKKE